MPRFFLFLCLCQALAAQPATLLITNARVWTANPRQPWAEAVAVQGNRIAAVGASKDLARFRGPATESIDARGRLLLPGFHDAHIHFLSGSLRLTEVDLTSVCTLPAMQERILAWAVRHPEAPWITGGGWEYTCFPNHRLPRREDLDAVVKDRPVFLRAYDGHTAWANSKALELAGLGKDTPFDGFGEIVRDPDTGLPTGALKEGAMSLVGRLLPPVTRQQRLAALEQGLRLAASLGITSMLNASGSREEVSLYEELLAQSKLTARMNFALSNGPRSNTCERDVDLLKKWRGPLLRVDAVKFMLDGVIESHTAAMLEPYSNNPATRGDLAWPEDQYRQAVQTCDAAGFQLLTHAIGDRAVRAALDAYQNTRRGRARIEHIEVVHFEDLPRFAQLGVIASMEPIHADPATVAVWSQAVGPARLRNAFAWRSLARAGARLAFSSDWPASISLDPIRGIHNAVNRQTVDGKPDGGWLPEQRVSLETALRAYTIDAAYAAFEENVKGSIEPGKLADLIVLSQDLFAIPPARIHLTRVDLTVFDGRVLYRRPE